MYTEWGLNDQIFSTITARWGVPEIDLFASRLNHKVPRYVSWLPDPGAEFIDAFTIPWGQFKLSYLFPPFRLLPRCLQKLRAEKTTAIVIMPAWRALPWYPLMLNMAVDTIRFKAVKDNLISKVDTKGKFLSNISLKAGLCS